MKCIVINLRTDDDPGGGGDGGRRRTDFRVLCFQFQQQN
jgi:hypothetical protein